MTPACFLSHKNNPIVEHLLNNELAEVASCLSANKLCLNVGIPIFSLCDRTNIIKDINLSINNETLEIVTIQETKLE